MTKRTATLAIAALASIMAFFGGERARSALSTAPVPPAGVEAAQHASSVVAAARPEADPLAPAVKAVGDRQIREPQRSAAVAGAPRRLAADRLLAAVGDVQRSVDAAAPRDADFDRKVGRVEVAFRGVDGEYQAQERRLAAIGLDDRRAEVHAQRLDVQGKAQALVQRLRAPGADAGALRQDLASAVSFRDPSGDRGLLAYREPPGTPRSSHKALDGKPQAPTFDLSSHGVSLVGKGGGIPSPGSVAPPLPAAAPVAAFQPDLPPPPTDDCNASPADPLCAPIDEGQPTPAIVAQVDALGGDTYAIYQFVRDRIAFEPYLGVNKSADAVLQTGVGGVQEKMLLLGTMLRVAGYPVEYAFGWVYAPVADVQAWLGQSSPDAALDILQTNLAYQPQVDGAGNTVGYYLYLSWVEAYVPYGARFGEPSQKRWVPLMPYWQRTTFAAGHPEVVMASPFDEHDFLSTVRTETASDYYRDELAGHLSQGGAGFGVLDVAAKQSEIAESVRLPPTTLPVEVVNASTVNRLTGMPSNYVLKAYVVVYGYNGFWVYQDFGYVFDLPESGAQRLTVSWQAASPYDQMIIDAYGGLANTPPGAVIVVGALEADGQVLVTGSPTYYGNPFNLQMYFQQFEDPNNPFNTGFFSEHDKWRVTGTFFNVGFDGMQYSPAYLAEREAELVATAAAYEGTAPEDNVEALTGELLHCAGVKYLLDDHAKNVASDGLYQYQVLRYPQHLTTESAVGAYYLFDRPYYVVPEGAVLDAWSLAARDHSLTNDYTQASDVQRVNAYASSALEHQLWEHFLYEEAVSTTKLLQRANTIGMPVFDFPAYTPASTIYASLNLPSGVVSQIANDSANGARIVVHQSQETINQWTGVGWFEQFSGGFGMLISGGLSSASAGAPDGGDDPGADAPQAALDAPSVALAQKLLADAQGASGPPATNGGAGTQNPPFPLGPGYPNPTGPNGNNYGDPVNLASGNVYHTDVDVRIPSVGSPLTFARAYNSDLAYSGPTGQRWTSTYESAVMPTGTPGELLYIDEVGSARTYVETPPGSGVFQPPAGYHDTIVYAPPYYVVRSKYGVSRSHDAATGRLAAIADRNGNTRTLTYDGAGKLTRVADGFGASLSFTYDASGRLASVFDHTGRTWRYQHDAAGNLVSVALPSDGGTPATSLSFAYDASSRMIGRTDGRGNTLRNDYYTDGKVHQQAYPDGRVYTYVFDTVYQSSTTVIQPDGAGFAYTFTPAGDVAKLVPPDGSVWAWAYDADRNVVAGTDPLGAVTSASYDPLGNPLTVTTPTGDTTTFSYDGAFSMPTALADVNGGYVTLAYDAAGNIETVTDGAGAASLVTTNASGQPTSVTDALGHATSMRYDAGGRLVAVTDRRGNVTSYTYDALNRMATQTLPDGTVLTYQADARDRLVAVLEGAAPLFSYAYDENGNMVSETNAAGASTLFAYDATDALVATTLPDGSAATLLYDARKHVVGGIDPSGGAFSREYDASGRLVSTTDAAGYETSFVNDSRGRVVEAMDALGRATGFAYDASGHLVRRTYADGTFEATTFDAAGIVLSATSRDGGVTTFAYDGRRNLVSITDPLSHVRTITRDVMGRPIESVDALGHVTSATYDENGNVATRTDANGVTSTFTYDALNHPTTRVVTDAQGTVLDTIHVSRDWTGTMRSASNAASALGFEHDALRRPTVLTTAATAYQPATSIAYGYDARSNVTSWTDPLGQTVGLGYDASSRMTRVSDPEAGTTTLSYDPRGMLLGVALPNGATAGLAYDGARQIVDVLHKIGDQDLGTSTLGYDATWDPTTRTGAAGTDAYVYDAAGGVVAATHPSDPPEAFTYDAVGNRTSANGAAYTYDDENRLLSDGTSTYAYDANGNRTRKTSIADPTTYTTYAYDYDNRLTGVSAFAGGVARSTSTYAYDVLGRRIQKSVDGVVSRYVYSGFQIAAEYDGANEPVARYVYGPRLDRPIAMIRGGHRYFYHQDQVGSVVAITDESGAVVQRYRYDTFGRRTYTMDPSFVQPFGFAGRDHDETGLVQMRARDYDPATGRFLQRDPLGVRGGPNAYAYANSDPLAYNDPFGLSSNGGNGDDRGFWKKLWDGYYFGTGYGQEAVQFYQNVINDPNSSWYAKGASYAGEFFSSLWTPDTWKGTAITLGTLGLGAELGAGEVAAEEAGAVASEEMAAEATGTVWDAVTATQPVYEGTVIPRSFELATTSGDVWVAPNATEHLAEYATSMLNNGVNQELVNVASQTQISSLQAAVQQAIANGVPYGTAVDVGGWELVFSPARAAGQLPALIHALPY